MFLDYDVKIAMESLLLNVGTLEEEQRHQINMIDKAKNIRQTKLTEMEREIGDFLIEIDDPCIYNNISCLLVLEAKTKRFKLCLRYLMCIQNMWYVFSLSLFLASSYVILDLS